MGEDNSGPEVEIRVQATPSWGGDHGIAIADAANNRTL